MIDSFLEAAYQEKAAAAARNELAEKLRALPVSDLCKLASGQKVAYMGVGDDSTWLDKFEGSDLYDEAVELEKQCLHIEAQEIKQRMEDRGARDHLWDMKDALKLKKRVLELKLREGTSAPEEGEEEIDEAKEAGVIDAARLAMDNPNVDELDRTYKAYEKATGKRRQEMTFGDQRRYLKQIRGEKTAEAVMSMRMQMAKESNALSNAWSGLKSVAQGARTGAQGLKVRAAGPVALGAAPPTAKLEGMQGAWQGAKDAFGQLTPGVQKHLKGGALAAGAVGVGGLGYAAGRRSGRNR